MNKQNVETKMGGARLVHTHVEADITDLDKDTQDEDDNLLDGKADVVHTHALDDMSNVDIDTPASTEVLTYDGAKWVNAVGGGGGQSGVAARVYRDGVQAIPNTTNTVILFQNENYDLSSNYNNGSGLFTCPSAGKYRVSAMAYWDTLIDTKSSWLRIQKNSSIVTETCKVAKGGNQTICLSITDLVDCAANDTLSIMIYQNTGGPLDLGDSTYGNLRTNATFRKEE